MATRQALASAYAKRCSMSETTRQEPGGWAGGLAAITLFVDDLERAKRF
jgi:hypothetical protein